MSALENTTSIMFGFKERLSQILQSGSENELYHLVPTIQSFFNLSASYIDDLPGVLNSLSQIPDFLDLKFDISEATQRMEIIAQKSFLNRLKSCEDDKSKIEFIRALGVVGTDFNCPLLNFELLPELENERLAAGIDHKSTVLILGTGSISITGLYFASFGAHVILLDRDPRALVNFQPVYQSLPSFMQERISFAKICDARDYDYPADITHIFMAALLEPKEPILYNIKSVFEARNNYDSLKILLRAPREDLMQYFYYDIDRNILNDFQVIDRVDLGIDIQTSISYVLRFSERK